MNKGIRNIKESLLRELMDMQVFWSYKKPDIYALSDDMLIEKVLLHSDLDSIYKLFDIFPENHIRRIWEQSLLPDERMHSTNLLFVLLLFRIKDPRGFIKSKIRELDSHRLRCECGHPSIRFLFLISSRILTYWKTIC